MWILGLKGLTNKIDGNCFFFFTLRFALQRLKNSPRGFFSIEKINTIWESYCQT